MKKAMVVTVAVLCMAGCVLPCPHTDGIAVVDDGFALAIEALGDSPRAVYRFDASLIGGNHDLQLILPVLAEDAQRLLEETRALSTVQTYAKGEGGRYINWWQSGETGSIWLFQPKQSIFVLESLWLDLLYISHYRLARAIALAEVAHCYENNPTGAARKFGEACDTLVSWAEDYHRREGWPSRPRHVGQWIERESRGGHKALSGETPEATAARLKGEWQRLSSKVMEISRADGGFLVIRFIDDTWPPMREEFQ